MKKHLPVDSIKERYSTTHLWLKVTERKGGDTPLQLTILERYRSGDPENLKRGSYPGTRLGAIPGSCTFSTSSTTSSLSASSHCWSTFTMANESSAMKSQQRVPERKEAQNSSNEPETSSLVVQQNSGCDVVQVDPVVRRGSSSRSGTPRSREELDGGEGVVAQLAFRIRNPSPCDSECME